MFASFIETLKNKLKETLPGEEAQFLMAPPARKKIKDVVKQGLIPRKSAVLILLYEENNSIKIVFIQRHDYNGVHSGQIGFPGGKFEEDDEDLKQTALRETYEEIGIPSESIEIIGNLSDVYVAPSNFLVTPFIGFALKPHNFIPDPREVKRVITLDLIDFKSEIINNKKEITLDNNNIVITPCFEIDGIEIWGATAMMMSEFLSIIR